MEMELSNGLTWHPDVEWYSFQLDENSYFVSFFKKGAPIIKIRLNQLEYLSLSEPFRLNVIKPQLINLFLERGLLNRNEQNDFLLVRIFANPNEILNTFRISSPKQMHLDLLVGDENNIDHFFKAFIESRFDQNLLGYLTVASNHLRLSPVRYPKEAEGPVQVGVSPRTFPNWRGRIPMIIRHLEELFNEAVNGSSWYVLTSKGFRFNYSWDELRKPYRETVSLLPQIKGTIPLVYAQGGIEGKMTAGGVGESIVQAENSARFEAWERYCLDRPDLAPRCDSSRSELLNYEALPGIHSEYLKSLTRPFYLGPQFVKGNFISNHAECAVPSHWVYFQEGNSTLNTTGTAFGNTLEEAVRYGKLELIERHSLMSVFLGCSSSLSLTDSDVNFDSRLYEGRKSQWYYLGECLGAHTVALALTRSTPPFLVFGVATRMSLKEAAKKAFFEAAAAEVIWAQKLEQLGPTEFVRQGKELLKKSPKVLGLMEGAWTWAATEEGGYHLQEILSKGKEGKLKDLDEGKFVFINLGAQILNRGAVVRVMHPDAIPFPSTYEHLMKLSELMKVRVSLPVPLT